MKFQKPPKKLDKKKCVTVIVFLVFRLLGKFLFKRTCAAFSSL